MVEANNAVSNTPLGLAKLARSADITIPYPIV